MDWENRVAALWAQLDGTDGDEFRERMSQLVAERPPGDAIAVFELAAASDSTGRPDLAVPLYSAALASGLTGLRRRRAVIQLASSLRNLERADEALALIEPELSRETSELDDAVVAVHALVLSSLGRDREGLSLVLEALAAHPASIPAIDGQLRAGATRQLNLLRVRERAGSIQKRCRRRGQPGREG